jgi:hypothetical protein
MATNHKMPEEEFLNSPWCAYAPGKEAWKRDGNFFTAEELEKMDAADDVTVIQPIGPVLNAD